MDSAELLQPVSASDLSLSLLILELGLQWTPMDSFGLFSHTWSVTLSKTLTPMNSNGLSWTLAASDLACVYSSLTLSPMNLYWLLFFFFSQAGFITLFKTLTHRDSNGITWTLPASSTLWLELVSTHPRTLTPMNSYRLLCSFLSSWIS